MNTISADATCYIKPFTFIWPNGKNEKCRIAFILVNLFKSVIKYKQLNMLHL